MKDDDLIRRGDARKAMADYHWKRYASRDQGGELSSPAVFTSHTWQHVQDIIAALPAVPAVPTPSPSLLNLRSIVRKAAADAREVFEGRKRATEAIGYMEQLILAATMTDALDTPATGKEVMPRDQDDDPADARHAKSPGVTAGAILTPAPAPDVAGLDNPVAVHLNMLRGTIAKPTVDQIIHLYGADALRAALTPAPAPVAGLDDAASRMLRHIHADNRADITDAFCAAITTFKQAVGVSEAQRVEMAVTTFLAALAATALPTKSKPAPDVAGLEDRLGEARDVLSGISSYLGAGMGDDNTTAAEYERRIRWGLDYQIAATVNRCGDVIEELSKQAYSGQSVSWGQIKSAVLAVSAQAPAPDVAGLVAALREAERFMEYFAGETSGSFVGSGTPQTCLASIRAALAAMEAPNG